MILENKEILNELMQPVVAAYKEQILQESEVLVLLITKQELEDLDIPQNALIKKIAEKNNKLCDSKHISNFVFDTEKGLRRLIIVGLGEQKDLTPNVLRKAAGEAARTILELVEDSVVVFAPSANKDEKNEYLGALAQGLLLGSYEFKEFKGKPEPKFNGDVQIYAQGPDADKILEEEFILCENILWARNLVNRPGNVVQPHTIAQEAIKIAEELGLPCEVLNREQMAAKGMGALLAVAQGSAAEPKLITLKYQGDADAPYIAFVGKGITFDSGGISIKPESGMGEMKDDMAGAAAVLGAVRAIAALKLPCNVMAIAVCAENMPSGTATRPGDIVKAANGKTIEVVSTDAEGRMVLADAVWYACRQGAAKVIDIATLTGAVIVALGNETAGIISNDDALCAAIVSAGESVGENYWRLPSLPECKEALKSDLADLLNCTGRPGGAITGGLFISEFVDEAIPWAHIDIGGTATTQKTNGVWVKGATGMGVATLVRLVKGI